LKQSMNLDNGKALSYEYGKTIIPDTILQHFFSSNWTLSRDYYIKRKVFSHELGTTAAFQMLINATALNSEQFFLSSNGYIDSTQIKSHNNNNNNNNTDDNTNNNNNNDNTDDKIIIRLTRNIQKTMNNELLITTAGNVFHAFIENKDVIDMACQLYLQSNNDAKNRLLNFAPSNNINKNNSNAIDSKIEEVLIRSINDNYKRNLDYYPSL